MARKKKQKYSKEEVLDYSSRLVAGKIDPEAMGITAEDIDIEQFLMLFRKKTEEMLEEKERMLFGVGPYLNKEGTLFTEDLKPIIEFIEKETKMQFHFFNGILVYLGKDFIYANWIPDRT